MSTFHFNEVDLVDCSQDPVNLIEYVAKVFIELWAIAWIQNRYMETPFLRAAFQVVLGGALVFAAGVLIGGG